MKPLPVLDLNSKPTNPKDQFGTNKIPYHLWPNTATILGAMAMLEGAVKYGRSNYRAMGVRASIYYDACRRHLDAWFEGEDLTPDHHLHHLGNALACLAIIVDAESKGVLVDDRMYPGGYIKLIKKLAPDVARIRDMYKDKKPHHYSLLDVAGGKNALSVVSRAHTNNEHRKISRRKASKRKSK